MRGMIWCETTMNERIKLLAQHAEQLADDELAYLERVHNRLYSFTEGREIYNQKFAELIVEECREVLTEVYRETPIECCGHFLRADEKITEHFYEK